MSQTLAEKLLPIVYLIDKHFGIIAPKILNYLAFQYFSIERHLMKVIPETLRVL